MTLTLSEITSRNEWNNNLAKMPHAHILQTWEWGEFKYETTGWQPLRWAFRYAGSDEIVAMCSMGKFSIAPFCVMYAPKGPALDYSNTALVDDILTVFKQQAKQHRAIWLKIDPDIAYTTGVPNEADDAIAEHGHTLKHKLETTGWRLSADQIQFRNTITIDLSRSEDDMLMAMSGNTRRKVRQAEKKDVTIREGTLNDLDMLYALYSTTGDRNEFLIRPKEYYLKLWRYFMESDLAHVLIAEYENKPIAHVILFHFGQTCWYFYGASANEERERMPTYALQWEAMKWAKNRGYTVYDMWGAPDIFDESDSMWGVYMFKQGFRGTVERRLGAWDYAPYPFLYKLYAEVYPQLLAWMRRRKS
jgi:peptidoglycan pentaglycine glycine transferase (the first glycine)